jgi:two-component system, OmpR family, KDP operon response regulator KdpE
VHLTPTEWELLHELVIHDGRTLTHRHLFHKVWGQGYGDPQGYLRVYIAHLRRKLESDPYHPRLLLTDAGVGYRFDSEGV